MAKNDKNIKSNPKVNETNYNALITQNQKAAWKIMGYTPNTYQDVVDIKQHRTKSNYSTMESAGNNNLLSLLISNDKQQSKYEQQAKIERAFAQHENAFGYNKKREDDEEEDDDEKENTRLGKKIQREKKFKSTGGIDVNK